VLTNLAASSIPLKYLNVGGGFPCQYDTVAPVPTIEEIGDSISLALAEIPDISLIAEPGRYVVASAATLTVTVIARVDRPNGTWLFTDAGCYNGLFEAMSYQGNTRYPVEAVTPNAGGLQEFNIAGPTGDSADVVARGVGLPSDTREGSQLIFRNVGAYTMSMSVPFNGFPKPAVLMI
jgi:ornithine decarboxylase